MILKAAKFAKKAHSGQFRKWTDEPFIFHCSRVAGRTALLPFSSEELVAAAYLHDVLEDTEITYDELKSSFGKNVADIVKDLTNPSLSTNLRRAERKAMDFKHLSICLTEVKAIKLLDRIDNIRDIEYAPLKFRKIYLSETKDLADFLDELPLAPLIGELRNSVDALM